MTTYSQLVDRIVAETRRSDMRTTIGEYLQQTIRELHTSSRDGSALLYGVNFKELAIPASFRSDTATVWEIPEPQNFQALTSVWYPNRGLAPKLRQTPSAALNYGDLPNNDAFFYRSGDSFVFAGAGAEEHILVGWYSLPRRLKYYIPTARPAQWDMDEDIFVYANGIVTPDEQAAARLKVTNWLLQRYEEVIMQGVRAKIYARINDADRARLSYSAYQNNRPGLEKAEATNYTPTFSR